MVAQDPRSEIPCHAVLFDCDGVLVDSDATVLSAWSRWAREHGLDPDEVTATVHGRRSADTVARLIAVDRRAEALALIDRYEVEDATNVRAVPGAAALLASMPAARWAVVTSGRRELALARLSAAGLPIPAVLVTADDVSRGKPDPEGYLAAAAALGVGAADTVVIEDAPSGVGAARAAAVGAVVGVATRDGVLEVETRVPDLTHLRFEADPPRLVVRRPSP